MSLSRKYGKSIGSWCEFRNVWWNASKLSESTGRMVSRNKKQYKLFRDMASFNALNKYSGGCKKYCLRRENLFRYIFSIPITQT
jgi:hypothetical protein